MSCSPGIVPVCNSCHSASLQCLKVSKVLGRVCIQVWNFEAGPCFTSFSRSKPSCTYLHRITTGRGNYASRRNVRGTGKESLQCCCYQQVQCSHIADRNRAWGFCTLLASVFKEEAWWLTGCTDPKSHQAPYREKASFDCTRLSKSFPWSWPPILHLVRYLHLQ